MVFRELSNLIGFLSDLEENILPEHIYKGIEKDQIISLLKEKGVKINSLLESDISRVYKEKKPLFFISEREIVNNFREKFVKVSFNKENNPFYFSELPNFIERELKRAFEEYEKYDINMENYRHGMACYNEQQFFYNTEEWKNRAKLAKYVSNKCENCNKNNIELHAHHIYPIQSIFSKMFVRNFQIGRIKVLCEKCHRKLHNSTIRRYYGFTNATNEEIEIHKNLLEKLNELHDIKKECQFCFGDKIII